MTDDRTLEWVERVAMFCAEEYGVPPIKPSRLWSWTPSGEREGGPHR